ncbi:MAG: TonB-dependent receptor [Betaproteobacteria bacterium]
MAFQRRKVATALAYLAGVGTAGMLLTVAPVFAQDIRVNVTGSNIKRVDNETASPIEVITRQDIERTGAVSVSEVLQFIPSAGFAIDDRVTNGFTNGAGALNVRNLGFNSTLILLNGRRLPTYPLAQRTTLGSQQFQDLNAIPVSAVERIEILKDGASAIYGADAVGGVVNIILRNNYTGIEAGASYGISQQGDGDTYQANASLGFGDLAKDRFNVFANLFYLKRDAMLAKDRPFANNEDLRGRGGTDFRSGFGYPGTVIDTVTGAFQVYPNCPPEDVARSRCRYNRAGFGGVYPEVERYSANLKGEFAITPDISIFAEGLYARNDAKNIGFPSPSTDDAVIGSNILPVGHQNNPFPNPALVAHRYADVGNRDTDAKGETWRGVLGLKGNYRAWDWEAYGSWNKIEIEERQLNNVLATTALETINDGSYNFFDPFGNPATTDRLRYNGFHTGKSTFNDYGVKASGEVWNLPAGPVLVAVGAQHTQLEVADNPDPQIAAGNALGISASAAFGKQDLSAVFGEIIVPVIKGVEISGALRYDKYTKSGDFSNTSPKIGIRYQPVRNLLLRATYSEVFRAPSIFETSTANQSSFEFGLTDPTRCITGAEPDCNLDVRLNQTGNPDLKPETSKVWNIGVVWEPTPNSSISVDYYQIKRKDEIGLFATQTLINLFPNNPAIVIRNPLGIIDTVNNVPVQFSKTTTSGVDVEGRLRIPLERYGTVALRGAIAYVDDYTFATLGDSGTIENFQFNGTYNQPRLRGSWDLSWLYAAHEVSLNGYYVGHYAQLNETPSGSDVTAMGIWNLFYKWNFNRNLTLNASIQNLLDRDPVFSNESSASNAGYNPSQSDPKGRVYQVGLQYRFR